MGSFNLEGQKCFYFLYLTKKQFHWCNSKGVAIETKQKVQIWEYVVLQNEGGNDRILFV